VTAAVQPLPVTPASALVKKNATPAAAPPSTEQKRIPFSEQETYNLYKGVERFGIGQWARVLSEYAFHPKRRAGDLKDKWRNLNSSASAMAALAASASSTTNRSKTSAAEHDSIEDSF